MALCLTVHIVRSLLTASAATHSQHVAGARPTKTAVAMSDATVDYDARFADIKVGTTVTVTVTASASAAAITVVAATLYVALRVCLTTRPLTSSFPSTAPHLHQP